MTACKDIVDKRARNKRPDEAGVIECLASLLGSIDVPDDDSATRHATGSIPFSTWLQLSKINLALTVHGLTKLNAIELDRLHEMDYVAADLFMYRECDSHRARMIRPSD